MQLQLPLHRFISLHQLGRGKTHGNLCLFRMILYNMGYGMNGTVNLSLAEVQIYCLFSIPNLLFHHTDQLIDPLIFACGDRHDRTAQMLTQRMHINAVSTRRHLVHHIQRNHHRLLQLHQLQRQIEVSFNIRSIHDIDDQIRIIL